MKLTSLLVFLLVISTHIYANPISWIKLVYGTDSEHYTLWMDCNRRSVHHFEYIAKKDYGNAPRSKNFKLDPSFNYSCQQFNSKGYGREYDRGHMVPANHFDSTENLILSTNYMTNILPQNSVMNHGAWYQTELITECYRDITPIRVIGGSSSEIDSLHNYFLQSHGVNTPVSFWKVIIKDIPQSNSDILAWIIPNSSIAKKEKLDDFIVTVKDIEKFSGIVINIPDSFKTYKPKKSWKLSDKCDRS